MKRLIIVALLVLTSGWALAQNVIGAPIYYNDSTGHRPQHANATHARSGHELNTWFFEVQTLAGRFDRAIGATLTYIPEDWGFYGSYLYGVNADWYSGGVTMRLTDEYDRTDLQLYAGLVIANFYSGNYAGGEFGLRIARPATENKLSLWSGSLGLKCVGGRTFFTMGLSLPLSILLVPTCIIF